MHALPDQEVQSKVYIGKFLGQAARSIIWLSGTLWRLANLARHGALFCSQLAVSLILSAH